tara:strand:- start:663 stop:893 length:231 start_codon:yes stop_codon:yes gene_type:complete
MLTFFQSLSQCNDQNARLQGLTLRQLVICLFRYRFARNYIARLVRCEVFAGCESVFAFDHRDVIIGQYLFALRQEP